MIFWLILTGVIGIVVGFSCGCAVKFFKVKELNTDLQRSEEEQKAKIDSLLSDKLQYQEDIDVLKQSILELNDRRSTEYDKFQQAVKEQEEHLTSLQATVQKTADEYYQKEVELAKNKVNNEKKQLEEYYDGLVNDYKNEYLSTLNDCIEYYKTAIGDYNQELEEQTQKLLDLREKIDALVEADKRKLLEETQKDFFRLVVSDDDLEEISKLREVSRYLKDAEPLNKVIWKVYYEKPYTALVGRVVGNKTKTGIYKITNLNNNMCYVGQAVDIADRWRQHIKRGLGAEAPTRNKLYPAMMSEGVENFSFEIIEECVSAELNVREKYWIECYHGQDYGYNIKAGG